MVQSYIQYAYRYRFSVMPGCRMAGTKLTFPGYVLYHPQCGTPNSGWKGRAGRGPVHTAPKVLLPGYKESFVVYVILLYILLEHRLNRQAQCQVLLSPPSPSMVSDPLANHRLELTGRCPVPYRELPPRLGG